MIRLRAVRQPLAEGAAAIAEGAAVPASGAAAGDAGPGGTAPTGDPSGVLAISGVITSQLALITALLYYFGWVRTHSFLSHFGIDPSMAGYGTADYLLRSIKVAFPPFIHAAFTALMLFGLHRLVVTPAVETAQTLPRRRPRAPGIRWFVSAVNVTGVALAGIVLIGLLLPEQVGAPLGLLLPLLLIAAVTLLAYVTRLRLRYPASLAAPRSRQATPSSRAYTLTLLAFGLVAALWAVGCYGDQVGTGVATDMVEHLLDEPGITIYSIERIAITGPGVVGTEITQPDAKYHYQYTGLRLLLHSSDRYLLLPVGWRHGQDRIFLLRDDDAIRVDITAH